jgi:hypothetical protein
VRWYQEEVDVDRHLPELSTYLGHVKVSDTYCRVIQFSNAIPMRANACAG